MDLRRERSMEMRTMTKADIPGGMRLKELAGWNQTSADWMRFLEGDVEGSFVVELDGVIRGTAATIVYGGRFAWVGMVLVDPEYRGRGIGTRLLERCIEHLDSLRVPCIKLDATPQGKPVYDKLGFAPEYELERWTLKRADSDLKGRTKAEDWEALPAPLFEFILKAEGDAFGRHGSFADHLGPWIAKDEETGARLLDRFLEQTVRRTIVTDCSAAN